MAEKGLLSEHSVVTSSSSSSSTLQDIRLSHDQHHQARNNSNNTHNAHNNNSNNTHNNNSNSTHNSSTNNSSYDSPALNLPGGVGTTPTTTTKSFKKGNKSCVALKLNDIQDLVDVGTWIGN